MDWARLRELVASSLREVQELSGRAWVDLDDDSKVVNVLDGFDSIAAIEATTLIEQRIIDQRLGARISVETLFVADRRSLTMREVVELLANTIAGD